MNDFVIIPAATETEKTARLYDPLIALAFVSFCAATVLHFSFGLDFMSMLMGFVLIEFSLVKLFNITTFSMRFRQYDLVASRIKAYGHLFPFIELALGLAYLGSYRLMVTSLVMLVIGSISLAGILISLRRKQEIKCACMGGSADMPLGTVTVIENGLMIAMALAYIAGWY